VLRIDRHQRALTLLPQKAIPEAGLKERSDIQQMIRSSPDDFFAEMGESLMLIGEEVRPTDDVDDRIDLLAVDDSGAAVVIELKRGSHKLQLLQALSYAATISAWQAEQFLELRAELLSKSDAEVEEDLGEFLADEVSSLNRTQRVVLIAEAFDYMILATAEWLNEQYGVDVRCYRLALSADDAAEYLTCTCVYPPPELAQAAERRRSRQSGAPAPWATWDDALAAVKNPAVVEFFERELATSRPNYLQKRILIYRSEGRQRVWVAARTRLAYVWQRERFEGDIDFWRERVSEPGRVQPVKGGTCLRFYLKSADDFERFRDAVRTQFGA
jgi:hypothetical protein